MIYVYDLALMTKTKTYTNLGHIVQMLCYASAANLYCATGTMRTVYRSVGLFDLFKI